MKDLRVTLIQSKLHWENPHNNIALFDALFKSIKKNGTDIILLPEMFNTGFTMQAADLAEEMTGPSVTWMKKKAMEKNAVVCGSLIIHEKNKFFNRMVWMKPDGVCQFYNKRHLFRMANEQLTFIPGKEKLIVDCKGWKVFPLVCYDLRFPVWSRRTVKENYDVLIYVANWPQRRNHAWKQLLIGRAIENQAFVVGLNRIGKDGNGINYSGDSVVIDPVGNKISKTKASQQSIETIALSGKVLNDWRNQLKAVLDADQFILKK